MSERLPPVTARQLVRALEKSGWQVHRRTAGHVLLRKEGYALVSIPMHSPEMPRVTLMRIIEAAGFTPEEFARLL